MYNWVGELGFLCVQFSLFESEWSFARFSFVNFHKNVKMRSQHNEIWNFRKINKALELGLTIMKKCACVAKTLKVLIWSTIVSFFFPSVDRAVVWGVRRGISFIATQRLVDNWSANRKLEKKEGDNGYKELILA